MERHLKERIVGATVIVALGIIIIPWLLDGPAQSSRPVEQALELPPATQAGRTYTIPLDPGAGPPVAHETPADAQPLPPRPDAGAVQRPAQDVLQAPQPAPPIERPIEQPSQPSPRPAPQPAPQPAPARDSAWTVQVGSFSQADNAEGLRKRLAAEGFDAFVSRVATDAGTMHRVRVGPVPDRPSAERLLERLRAAGQQGRVVQAED
jgi:DedD protein